MRAAKFRSIFTSASKQQRTENFENYWLFTQQHGGELLEDDKLLPHRMREISDSLKRSNPKAKVEFKSTSTIPGKEWQLEYTIWKLGR